MRRYGIAAVGILLANGALAASAPDDMVRIPAGAFVMGSDKVDKRNKADEFGSIKPWYVDEHPRRNVPLPAYYIDLHEVTRAQYREFVRTANYWIPPSWKENGYLLTRDILDIADAAKLRQLAANVFHLDMDTTHMAKEELLDAIARLQATQDTLPVADVTWSNADDYCRWAGKRLPSEAEWEKAARGTDGREYPWGNEWDASRLNGGGKGDWETGVAPVGSYPQGVSPYGVHDMAGNVMEWVQDWYQAYPGNTHRSKAYGKTYKIVRGGGWGGVGHYAIEQFYRAAYRMYIKPDTNFGDIGFRCAKDASK